MKTYYGVIEEAEYRINRNGRSYLSTCIKAIGEPDVYVNIAPWMPFRYKEQLENLGLELELYYEWEGVDLRESMFPMLAGVLEGRILHVCVSEVSYQSGKKGLHAVIA